MEENNALCCLFLGLFYAGLSTFVYTFARLWNKFSEQYENDSDWEDSKPIRRKQPIKRKRPQPIKRKKPQPIKKRDISSASSTATESSDDEVDKLIKRRKSRSVSKKRTQVPKRPVVPVKKRKPVKRKPRPPRPALPKKEKPLDPPSGPPKTIKTFTLEKSLTKETKTPSGEKIKTDVDAELFIEKHPITEELDVDVNVTIDPKSNKPMKVHTEALMDNEKATVTGKATGKDKGLALIEAKTEKNNQTATEWTDIELDLTKKNKATDDMDLDFKVAKK